MTPEDLHIIQEWSSDQGQGDLNITLATAQNQLGEQMKGFCDELQGLLSTLKVKKKSDETGFSPPAMIMGRHNNIAFQAMPSSKVLVSLLSALEPAVNHAPKIDDALFTQLQQIDLPVTFKLYVAHQCPHCPNTLAQLLPLAAANHHLRLTIIDAQQFDQAAEADQIRSVPTLIVEDQFRWSGPMVTKEILDICIQRDPTQLSAASLRQLIEDGQAPRVAQMMVDAKNIFPALADLITHERWSVRLGAMVAAEYLGGDAPTLALELATLLWHRFGDLPDPIRGDVLHVIGQSHDPIARGYLDSVLFGQFDQDVKDAAADALEDMPQDL